MGKLNIPMMRRIKDRTKAKDPETGCMEFKSAFIGRQLSDTRAMYIKDDKGNTVSVLRVVYMHHHNLDYLSGAFQVRHISTCKNKRCINPEHLILRG